MHFESDNSRDASPQRDRLLFNAYRKAGSHYWIFIAAVAVVILIFILASSILKRPSAASIVISILIVLVYISLAYFCRPKHPARDSSHIFIIDTTETPLTWSLHSSMRHQAEEITATIELAIPTFSYSRKAGDASSGISSPRQVICSVCLALLVEGEQVRQLPQCKHIFHADCIAKWLPLHMSCPICRAEVDMTKYVRDTEERRSFDSTEHPMGSISVV